MENPSSRVIELTVLSGEGLRIDRRLIKKNAFAIVQTDAFNYRKTKVDESGGSYPTWNEKLVMELPMHARFIDLQLQCKASNSGNNNKTVGFAKIPVSDFIGGYVPENYLHFLSYRLRDAKGDKNGIINVSVRVKLVPEYTTSNYSSKSRLNVQGYTPDCSLQAATGLNVQGYSSYLSPAVGFGGPVGGVVNGIPVWCANRA